jgi:hypothetical protein
MELNGWLYNDPQYMTKHRLSLFPLVLFPMMGLAMYAYIGNFTRMLADDFCSIYFADRLGLFRSIWYWYFNWSGRYTAYAADWLILKSILGPYRLHYVVPATIVLWLLLITFTVYMALEKKHESASLHAVALAAVVLYVVLLLTPGITQSLYWWNGMRSYALPLVLLSLYVLLFQVYQRLNISPLLGSILGFLLFFLSGGMGETMAVAQTALIVFVIGLYLLDFFNRPRTDLLVLYGSLAGAVCSLIVVILSPGNTIRQALMPPPPNLITLITISLQSYGMFLWEILREPAKAFGLVAAVLAAIWVGGQYRAIVSVRSRLILVCILGSVLISFACFPPGVYGYSAPPPPRIGIIPMFFLVTGLLYAGFLLGAWLANQGYRWLESIPYVLLITVFMGFSSIATVSHLYQGRAAYISFARKWDQVDAQILQAKAAHQQSVNIPAMDNWTGLERPNENIKYWPNQCYSSHYGIQVIGPPYSE